MPKRIAVTVTNDLNQDQRMHRICNSLMDAGYEVVLIGREKRSSSVLLEHKFAQKRLKCWFESGVLFYLEYNIRLFFFLMFYAVDIVYSVDLDTLGAGGLVSIVRRKKLVHDAHEYFVEVPELDKSKFKKWMWNLVARLFIPRSNLNITVNQELAEVLKDKYHHKFKVIRSVPVLDDTHDSSEQKKEKIILYQGVLNKGRGLEDAIRWISKKKENIQLHIAGEGDLSDSLRKLKREVDENNRVHFLGWKSPKELDKITKSAWLGLNLLDGSSLNYKYSLANKFFSYMHAGVPSVNMDFPVYARYCREDNVGICISDLSEDAIDKAILPLLTEPARYEAMVEATVSARKKHSWQEEGKNLIEFIDEMMKR